MSKKERLIDKLRDKFTRMEFYGGHKKPVPITDWDDLADFIISEKKRIVANIKMANELLEKWALQQGYPVVNCDCYVCRSRKLLDETLRNAGLDV